MKLFSSLDRKDRQMLAITVALVLGLLVILALVTPRDDADASTIPDSFLAGTHGAKAAYTLLEKSGYAVERWQQPLSDLAARADSKTVLILAEPESSDDSDLAAIASILNKGGRVVATGFQGGMLMPGNEVTPSLEPAFAACEAEQDGINPLSGWLPASGSVWIKPLASWNEARPDIRTAYTCGGKPVVVTYPVGKGTVIWWASSTPLENSSITRGNDLELLLNSVGPVQAAAGQRVYWDESLHSAPRTQWDFVKGPVWPLFLFGSLGLLLLVILSFSRRSGPVRTLPQAPRTTPIEFLDALGSLYRSTGASATAVQIAWERFRSQAGLLTGQRTSQLNAVEIAAAIERRFGAIAQAMAPDLVAAEEACWNESLKPRRALALVQALRRHEQSLRSAGTRGKNFLNPAGKQQPASLTG